MRPSWEKYFPPQVDWHDTDETTSEILGYAVDCWTALDYEEAKNAINAAKECAAETKENECSAQKSKQ